MCRTIRRSCRNPSRLRSVRRRRERRSSKRRKGRARGAPGDACIEKAVPGARVPSMDGQPSELFREPSRDCPLCPRLVAFRHAARAREPSWFNAPVPSFGPLGARLLIVGLAPGLKGANRTGRPFTGDHAGELLYDTLARYGFARGTYGASPDDGLELVDARITNTVRCVPPENKPTPAEINTCRGFLEAPIA